jgi:hypothetical protein
MRETRTYGLTRGCWSVRFARRTGVYSTRFIDVTVAPPVGQVESWSAPTLGQSAGSQDLGEGSSTCESMQNRGAAVSLPSA